MVRESGVPPRSLRCALTPIAHLSNNMRAHFREGRIIQNSLGLLFEIWRGWSVPILCSKRLLWGCNIMHTVEWQHHATLPIF